MQIPGAPDPVAPASDLAHLSQAERATRALAESKRDREVPIERAFLLAALDYRQTLRILVAALVPRFADWCFVDLVDGDGIPRRVEVAHSDPAKAPLAQQMRSISFGPGWATPSAQAMRDRGARLYREVSNELMEWATHDDRHLAVLRAIRPNSLLSVPLVARDRVIGAITLIRSTMLPAFGEGDLIHAEQVAAPAALALDNARWYQTEKSARAAAEEQADRERHERIEAEKSLVRLRRLESLSATFAGPLSPQALARFAVENGLSALEFSSATVVQALDGILEVLHSQGWPDDLALETRRLAVDDPALVAEAYRSQTALWVPNPEALRQSHPSASELARRIGDEAWASAPLRVDGRTIGALSLGFPRPRDLDAGERRYLLTVSQLLAQALERARLRDMSS